MSGSSNSKKTSSPSLSDTSLGLNESKNVNFNDPNDSQENKSLLDTAATPVPKKINLLDGVDGKTNINDTKNLQRQVSSGKKWV